MIIEETFSIITCIWALALGSYILIVDRKSLINRVFIAFMFILGFMTLLDTIQGHVYFSNVALLIAKIKYGFMVLLATLFLHFSFLLGDFKFIPNVRIGTAVLYTFSFIFIGAIFTPFIISDVDDKFKTITGPLYFSFLAYIFIVVIIGLVVLVSCYIRTHESVKKKQLQIIFIGMGTTVVTTFILFGIFRLPGSIIFTLPMFFFFAYAIVKYKLLKVPELVLEEDIFSEPIDYDLEPGYTYIIPEREPKLGFQLFAKSLKEGAHGICITMHNPNIIRKRYGLKKTPIISITNKEYNDLSVKPGEISSINGLLKPYFQNPEKSVIYLIDDKAITAGTNLEDHSNILELSNNFFKEIVSSNSRFIISVSPGSISPKTRMPIIKTKTPLLEFTRLTAFVFEEICNDILQFLIRNGYLKPEKIPVHLTNLSKKDSFFKNVSYRKAVNPRLNNNKIRLTNILEAQRLSKQILIDKIKLFLSEFKNIETATDFNSIVLNSISKYGLSKNEFQLHLGDSYIIPGEDPKKAFEIFSEFVSKDFKGLCITKSNPNKIMRKYALSKKGVKTYWLTDISDSKKDVLPPKLEHILSIIEEFVLQTPDKKIILLDGIEYLIFYSGDIFDAVLSFLRRLIDRISETNALILIPLDTNVLSKQRMILLKRSGMEIYKPIRAQAIL